MRRIGLSEKCGLFPSMGKGACKKVTSVTKPISKGEILKSILVSMTVAAGLMVAGSAMAADMPDLAKKNGCAACHAIDKKLVGPAFADISKKYKGAQSYKFKGKEYPLVEGLMMKVSQGGTGNWGSVAMIPNDPAGKKQDQIKELVNFVLALDK